MQITLKRREMVCSFEYCWKILGSFDYWFEEAGYQAEEVRRWSAYAAQNEITNGILPDRFA